MWPILASPFLIFKAKFSKLGFDPTGSMMAIGEGSVKSSNYSRDLHELLVQFQKVLGSNPSLAIFSLGNF